MQTFLPLPNFSSSARVLDRKRLFNQGNESLVILKSLRALRRNEKYGWQRHPAVLMWKNHEVALCAYTLALSNEMHRRTNGETKNTYAEKVAEELEILAQENAKPDLPWWFGVPEFHSSHRSRLLEKDPVWYGSFGWTEQPGGPEVYWWPTKKRMEHYALFAQGSVMYQLFDMPSLCPVGGTA